MSELRLSFLRSSSPRKPEWIIRYWWIIPFFITIFGVLLKQNAAKFSGTPETEEYGHMFRKPFRIPKSEWFYSDLHRKGRSKFIWNEVEKRIKTEILFFLRYVNCSRLLFTETERYMWALRFHHNHCKICSKWGQECRTLLVCISIVFVN